MNRPCKILFVSNTLSCGGAERQLTLLANTLNASEDFVVDVLYYGQKAGAFASTLTREPIFVDKDTLGSAKCIRAIKRILKEGKYDVLHAVGGGTANIYGRAAAVLARTPVVIGAMRGKRHFASRGMRFANNVINLFANEWTVNNPALIPILKRDLIRIRDEHVKLIYNAFPCASEVDYRVDETLDYDTDKGGKFVFLSVGRLAKVKNFPLFLSAASRICRTHENVRFWIIGDGDQEEGLHRLAKELGLEGTVVFWGYRADVDSALARADVYVQVSDSEGTPNTVLEAMRAARPVICTSCTDLAGIVEDGKNGVVIPCGDEDALVEAMEGMLCLSEKERQARGMHSAELFERGFLAEQSVGLYRDYYRKLLEEKR